MTKTAPNPNSGHLRDFFAEKEEPYLKVAREYAEGLENEWKGDVTGHDFHGNQWTGGRGSFNEEMGRRQAEGDKPIIARLNAAEDRIKAALSPHASRVVLNGFDPKMAEDVAATFEDFGKEFPGPAAQIEAVATYASALSDTRVAAADPEVADEAMSPLDDNTPAATAHADGSTVMLLNADQFSSPERFAEMANQGDPGDHPISNYTPNMVVEHELGHVVEHYARDHNSGVVDGVDGIMDRNSSAISRYAEFSPEEAFAEAFMAQQEGQPVADPEIERGLNDVIAIAHTKTASPSGSSSRWTCRNYWKPESNYVRNTQKSEVKSDDDIDFLAHWANKVDKYETLVHDTVTRFVMRHKKATLAKLGGAKARKDTRHWDPPGEKKIDPKNVVNEKRWRDELQGDMSDVLGQIVKEVGPEAHAKVMKAVKGALQSKGDVAGHDFHGNQWTGGRGGGGGGMRDNETFDQWAARMRAERLAREQGNPQEQQGRLPALLYQVQYRENEDYTDVREAVAQHYPRLVGAVSRWAGNPAVVDAVQSSAEHLLAGGKVRNAIDEDAQAFLHAIGDARSSEIPLYRGATNAPDFSKGDTMKEALASFTASRDWANAFAGGMASGEVGQTPTVFKLEPGAKAVPIWPLGDPIEEEWVTSGSFQVSGVAHDRIDDGWGKMLNAQIVTLQQVEKKVAPYDSAPPFEDSPYAPYSVVEHRVVPNTPGVKPGFDDADPNVADFIEERSKRLADFSDRTSAGVRQIVADGEDKGRSIDQIAGDLNDYYGNSEFWADRIAQTEVNGAMNATAMFAGAQSGVIGTKVWNTAIDKHTRPEHEQADGQTKQFDEPFEVGGEELEHPGDEAGSAENCINCRCVVTFGLDNEALAGEQPEST